MKIIAVTGLIGSGKGEAAEYIAKKYHYTLLDHSIIMEDFLKQVGRPTIRNEKRKLRIEKGNTFTAELINREIKKKNLKKVVIGSLRLTEEYQLAKESFPETLLMVIHTEPKIRYKRLLERKRDKPKDWKKFLVEDKNEEKIFHFTKTFSYADVVISNNSTLNNLYRNIDQAMKRL